MTELWRSTDDLPSVEFCGAVELRQGGQVVTARARRAWHEWPGDEVSEYTALTLADGSEAAFLDFDEWRPLAEDPEQ